jgi:hypothetical protein
MPGCIPVTCDRVMGIMLHYANAQRHNFPSSYRVDIHFHATTYISGAHNSSVHREYSLRKDILLLSLIFMLVYDFCLLKKSTYIKKFENTA